MNLPTNRAIRTSERVDERRNLEGSLVQYSPGTRFEIDLGPFPETGCVRKDRTWR